MKIAQVNKLFAGLTGHEKAVMAFNASSRGDDSTLKAIVSSMPMQNFIGVDIDYRRRVGGLTSLALYYGLFWYREKSLLMYGDNETDTTPIMNRLAAIHTALVEVCDKYSLDIESIKIMGMCEYETIPTWYAPPELIAEYAEMFIKLVE